MMMLANKILAKNIGTWFRAKKIAVNIRITKFIIFHNKGKQYI